jgi:2-polyprenyl-3-methyl-5-hydroxy-6-metoxy-1,4-benzoquinol methylase
MKGRDPESHSCPVCGCDQWGVFARARDVEYYSSEQTFRYLSCNRCDSVYLDYPPVDRLQEIYPANYYSYRAQEQPQGAIERIKEYLDVRTFRELLSRMEGNNLKVLDVGGGSGWLLNAVRKASGRVKQTHEVDIDEGARASAEAAGHIFHHCKVEEFSCAESFDLILMLNLIEHVADPGAVLRAMGKLLSPKGLILIKTPNVDTLDCRIFRHHNWGGFHCPRHFVLFNRQSIMELGERCGLRTVKATYTQGAPQWACSILGWMGLKGWLRISAQRPLYIHPLYPIACAAAAGFDFVRMPFMPTAQMFVVFQREA